MTRTSDPVAVLSTALTQAGDVLAAVRPDQLSSPTPCPDWDVRRLIAHLVAAPSRFATAMGGGEPDWSADPEPASVNGAVEFRAGAEALIHHWDVLDDSADRGQADWQTAEIAVHTWDLVRATGQSIELAPEVAERGLAFMSAGLTAENRGAAFAAEVAVPDDASVYDRLAAVAGRDPVARRDRCR